MEYTEKNEQGTYRTLGGYELRGMLVKHKVWVESGGEFGEQAHFDGCRVHIENLRGAVFEKMDFSGADLSGSTFTDCYFDKCHFDHAILNDVTFSGCHFLNETTFDHAQAYKVTFDGGEIGESSLQDFHASRLHMHNVTCRNSHFEGMQVNDMEIRGGKFDLCWWQGAILNRASMTERVLFRDCPMQGMKSFHGEWGDSVFEDCNLKGAIFKDSYLNAATLDACLHAEEMHLYGTNVENTNTIHGTKLPETFSIVRYHLSSCITTIGFNTRDASITSEDLLGHGKKLPLKDFPKLLVSNPFEVELTLSDRASLTRLAQSFWKIMQEDRKKGPSV